MALPGAALRRRLHTLPARLQRSPPAARAAQWSLCCSGASRRWRSAGGWRR
ncbi:hypothetical protein ACPA9J_14945 [Pseudomonas aeruginosa]